jgi:hypothetical protein
VLCCVVLCCVVLCCVVLCCVVLCCVVLCCVVLCCVVLCVSDEHRDYCLPDAQVELHVLCVEATSVYIDTRACKPRQQKRNRKSESTGDTIFKNAGEPKERCLGGKKRHSRTSPSIKIHVRITIKKEKHQHLRRQEPRTCLTTLPQSLLCATHNRTLALKVCP